MNGGTSPLFDSDAFEPTVAAAMARLAAVRPAAYARTRNALQGDVTRLSPYLTHGFITLPQALRAVLQRGPLPVQHKLVYEFAWREYFHTVWAQRGEGIFESLHEGVLPDAAYARELPVDIRRGATGLPVIDQAVRTLYATGYLHNHARMWLASYVVHWRKVHWRAGADWLYGHLLDGDLASNHLSWQWVAGTGSHKPYLFNAENVARYAPPAWHCRGTVLDTGYEQVDRVARSSRAVTGAAGAAEVDEPELRGAPPEGSFTVPDGAQVQGRAVALVHPWALGHAAAAERPPFRHVGVLDAAFHRRWPWSERRWRFVMARMQVACDAVWLGTTTEALSALAAASSVDGLMNLHLHPAWAGRGLRAAPRLSALPRLPVTSFSQFWNATTKGFDDAGEWLTNSPSS